MNELAPVTSAMIPAPVQQEPAEQPDFSVPVNWSTSKRHMGRVVLAGIGNIPSRLMMITSSVLEEDTAEELLGRRQGVALRTRPEFLKGPHGIALKDLCLSVGISISADAYFTALCKWLLPKSDNLSPKPKHTIPGHGCLDREIRAVAPGVIVTFGKAAFEFVVKSRAKFADAIGMTFWSEEYQCRVVPMQHYYYVLAKPEWTERFYLDMAQVSMLVAEVGGATVARVPTHYSVIRSKEELARWTASRIIDGTKLLSVDCEWHGRDHVDGELRSVQFCWADGHAVYIRFRDEQRNFVFDCSYAEAGAVLAPLWNKQDLKLVGHHISADLPWLYHWLKLPFYNKAVLDTEFAYQCVNEHGDRGLERMSLRYSDCGRYEFDLEQWKKDNKKDVEGGYGLVPDNIIIPYACADVDVPFRAYPKLKKALEQQGMWGYYSGIMNPFVTNVFTQFALTGLPMNRQALTDMREVYHFAKGVMEKDFSKAVRVEAQKLLCAYICEHLVLARQPEIAKEALSVSAAGMAEALATVFLSRFDSEQSLAQLAYSMGVPKSPAFDNGLRVRWDHYVGADKFNIRSPDMMKRWLFDVKGYTPLKSTANKNKGIPSMDWTKVLTLPPDKRKELTPAIDKQTLVVLSDRHKDPLLRNLLELNAVGNICKAFLNQPERDENGEVIEEAGLLAWIASDGCVHGQFSMTETGRPRSWKPNSLNWPAFVQERIVDGIHRALQHAHDMGELPAQLVGYLDGSRKILPLRSCVQAPEGSLIVESDFATAEIRALAFIGDDADLIRIITGKDESFGIARYEGKKMPVRLAYDARSGIKESEQDSACLMSIWKDNVKLADVLPEDLVRGPDGNLEHPGHDLHWSLAEMVQGKPREKLNNKADRGAAKVGNFCIAKGQKVLTRRGLVNIEDVMCCDLLWDGDEWVQHEGVVHTGRKKVTTYQGLSATDNHEVWTVEKGKVSFGEARTQRLELVRPAYEGKETYSAKSDSFPQVRGEGHCCKRDDQPISWEAEVYDIVNAGPRHRYVCSGVLVSNSSMYGATPATLERKIEADTGVAPEPGVGDRTLKALEDRQPSATAFLKGLEEAPESPGWLRAASGKVRHFQLPKCSAGVPWKLFKSQKSAQGREARNFFMQESVAATAMRAANWLLAFKMRYGLSGVPMTVLYDSVCTLTENRERYVWAKAHEICMHLANGWEYHGRVLRYPIDTDLNSGWSLGPDKDPRYKGREKIFSDSSNERDPALEPMEKWLDSLIDYFKQYERASLNFSGLAS